MAEGNDSNSAATSQEVERDFKLTTLVTHLNELPTKISEVENQCKSHGRSIQLIRTLMSYTVSPLHSNELLGLPSNTRTNPTNGEACKTRRAQEVVPRVANLFGDLNSNGRLDPQKTNDPIKNGGASDHSAYRKWIGECD
uniref:Uncharacterized protein n=1 Tax=Solanum tuberosum TaxID=4113 RepID=M1DM33_SOLTU